MDPMPASLRRSRPLLLSALLLGMAAAAVRAEVVMVYSVQRHGARNVLPKTSTLKESDAAGGPTLLPEGQRQAWEAGLAYRERYLNSTACPTGAACLDATETPLGPEYGVVGTDEFNNFNVLVRSSALDRTIMTARSFLDATFPPINNATATRYLPDGQQVVPVYSLPDDGAGAPLIRAYTQCDAYDARLLNWYNSSEFQAKVAETAAFRKGVGALVPGLNVELENWWNVYDGFHVYRTYGVGTPLPDVDNATFTELQSLAYWLETSKMRSNLTGNLLGGAMLADILAYMDAAKAAVQSNTLFSVYYQMLHVSAHYNTQLGLLGALEVDQLPAAQNLTWFRKIPSLAAVMAFELHADLSQSPSEYAVRLVMQDGPKSNYTSIPLPCASPGDGAEVLAGEGACTLDAFTALVQPVAFNTTEDWCSACNITTGVDACRLQAVTRDLQTAQAASIDASNDGGGSELSAGATVGIVVGCVAAAVLACGMAFMVYRRHMKGQLEQAKLGHANSLHLTA